MLTAPLLKTWCVLITVFGATIVYSEEPARLTLAFEAPHWLVIRGTQLPSEEIRVNYLEAYCRANSTDADWVQHTVISHRCELVERSEDGQMLKLRDRLADGVTVEHTITAGPDEVDFRLRAHNPSTVRSEAHWAQPCVRLAAFTGYDPQGKDLDDYLPKCFIFLNQQLVRLPDVNPWAKRARYTPGQVWCPRDVPRTDVNPRPLNQLVPSNGLIGAFSADESQVFATAWQPYQELFQGVARCLHSDLRLGGIESGETREIRGKIYIVAADIPALLTRYAADFPEHQRARGAAKELPLPGDEFDIDGHTAFLIAARGEQPESVDGTPWVWYAPTLPGLPGPEETWMFEQFRAAGIAIAGIDVGESYGSPAGRKLFSRLHDTLRARGYAAKPVLLGRSRGGLMTLAWATENPEKVAGFAGIYPVCNLLSYPGLQRATAAYGITAEELATQLTNHNPIDRLAPLAHAGVPLFAIHGDQDTVVPLDANSRLMKQRYDALGGSMELLVPPGQGHNMWPGFFRCQELVDFVKRCAMTHPSETQARP